MNHRALRPAGVVVAALGMVLTGCAGSSYPVVVNTATGSAPGAKAASLVNVAGHVLAPAGIVATGGGNIVATGGGNIVATGGGNIVATGGGNFAGRQLLTLGQAPLPGAQVYLADATGAPLPNTPTAVTGNDGGYSLGDVPAGFTFVVAVKAKDAKGHDVALETMAHTTVQGATADVSLASTCVTVDILDGRAHYGDVDGGDFAAARDAMAARLDAGPAPDLSDHAAVLTWLHGQETASTGLAQDIARLKGEVALPPANTQDPTAFFSPAPAAPSSAPSTAPSAAPTDAPSAAATAMPSRPPVASPAPGQLMQVPIAGALLDDHGGPLANSKLVFAPRSADRHQTVTVTTDAHGNFFTTLAFGTAPDSYDISLNGNNIGLWTFSGDPQGTGVPASHFANGTDPTIHIQVIY